MPEVEKILRLVSEGLLTPQEADEILSALSAAPSPQAGSQHAGSQHAGSQQDRGGDHPQQPGRARQLRIEVTENGHRVVNLRVPFNIAGWAANYLPGLSDQDSERIRSAIASGVKGAILDIGDDHDRVVITGE